MDKPLTKWYCDFCGEPIEDTEYGYVIWHYEQGKHHSFKIIHQGICDKKEYKSSQPLNRLTGKEGLVRLLAFLSPGPLIEGGICNVASLDEFVELFRRVQTPYYEEARRYFGEEKVRERFIGCDAAGAYLPKTLKGIIGSCQTL